MLVCSCVGGGRVGWGCELVCSCVGGGRGGVGCELVCSCVGVGRGRISNIQHGILNDEGGEEGAAMTAIGEWCE